MMSGRVVAMITLLFPGHTNLEMRQRLPRVQLRHGSLDYVQDLGLHPRPITCNSPAESLSPMVCFGRIIGIISRRP